MTVDQARTFVMMRDAQDRVNTLYEAIQDTRDMFDPLDPQGSNRRIAEKRAQLSRELAAAALKYSRFLETFASVQA